MSTEESTEHSDDDMDLLSTNEQWALIRSPSEPEQSGTPKDSSSEIFFFVWTSDEDMPSTTLAACQELNIDPPAWSGIKLSFKSMPSPGFCLVISKGWEPANPLQEEELFAKLIWEIKRAQGKA